MAESRTVSIIIPAYNEQAALPTLLAALCEQTYPRHLIEIIVVDNNSTDRTAQIARQWSDVTLLSENRQASSDLARNTGIQHARGDILAFTDSDCSPEPDWLSRLVAAIPQDSATLAAGRIFLELPAHPTGGQIYDSMSFLNHEFSVRFRKIAFTANLAVPRQVALAVGGIPMQSKTCGDSYFARLCHHHGCDMVYVPDAIVRHPTRRVGELIHKTKLIAIANARGGTFDRLTTNPRRGYQQGWRRIIIMPHLRALRPWLIARHLRSRSIPLDPILMLRTWSVAVVTLTWGILIAGVAQPSFRVVNALKLLPFK